MAKIVCPALGSELFSSDQSGTGIYVKNEGLFSSFVVREVYPAQVKARGGLCDYWVKIRPYYSEASSAAKGFASAEKSRPLVSAPTMPSASRPLRR